MEKVPENRPVAEPVLAKEEGENEREGMSAGRRRNALAAEKRMKMHLPRYTLGEEIFSSVSHGVPALGGVAVLVLLLVFCEKTPLKVASAAIYGGTLVLLYTVSTIYHALGLNKAKVVFRALDHCSIFLLIAGTYTPITMVSLGGRLGWVMFWVIWAASIIGVVLNAISVERYKVASMICYLAMSWVVVFAVPRFAANVSSLAVWCLLLGGVAFTVGAVLYGVGKKVPYMHSVFHLFVLAGSVLHTVCVYQIVK